MIEAFSIPSERCSEIDATLREEIQARTENSEDTTRILRSIQRFGGDPTIERFDMIPQPVRSTVHLPSGIIWTVKAVRAPRLMPEPVAE